MKKNYTQIQVQPGAHAVFVVGSRRPRCTFVELTPELAKEWLQSEHENNRNSTPRTVERYAREMKAGEWRLSPEPIVFSIRGYLINGGHRCRAVILSGATIWVLVWFDWPDDAFAVLDRPRVRSLADGGRIMGETYAKELYQVARAYLVITEGTNSVADHEVRAVVNIMATAWESIGATLISIKILNRRLRAAALAAALMAFLRAPDLVVAFLGDLQRVASREGVGHRSIHNFVRWYESSSRSGGEYNTKETAYAFCGALRQFSLKEEKEFVRGVPEAWDHWFGRPFNAQQRSIA